MNEDLFDELDIIEEQVEDTPVSNEEVSDEMSKIEKTSMETQHVHEKTYPYVEIILDEESRINAITKDALDSMLTGRSRSDLDGESLRESVQTEKPTTICLGVSLNNSRKVLGYLDISQISYLYNLLRNNKLSFEPEEGLVLQGTSMLALI